MERNLPNYLSAFPDPLAQYPEPLETRLIAHFEPGEGVADKEVMVALKGDGRIHDRDWIRRQPGSNYFHISLGYPGPRRRSGAA